ncbi:VIT family-domain-containing protein [Phakopsora pachyrhizi]|uniref:VIT family-domain-containing protein n=1 Tax=Phakopsora pachyrhizi TaxID=170000 RepID=A0AAV0BGT8_PHAPC|nr:VIT family-domain-containing protein [Phakopsora pachyrhizi]CAH7686524.1 VIT family-domain-containing protein [Phakopsora pachyrhizi]
MSIPSNSSVPTAKQPRLSETVSSRSTTDKKIAPKIWDYFEDSNNSKTSRTSNVSSDGSGRVSAGPSIADNQTPPIQTVSLAPTDQLALDKCDKLTRPESVCCRDLRGDDERHLINPDIVRDVIIGLSDGLTVPFGLTAGLSSLGSSRLVVVGGIAELISGAISMGIGGYLASEAERDHFRYLQRTTKDRVSRSCAGEMEREVHEVLGPIGLDQSISRTVAGALLRVEAEDNQSPILKKPEDSLTRKILKLFHRKSKLSSSGVETGEQQLRWSNDVGMTAFLIKFGEGLEEVPESRLYISALTIGSAYFIGGLVPMAPYFFIPTAQIALYWSIFIMLITLLIFGVFKAYFTGAKIGFLGYLKASSSTIIVGGAAAAASWLIVKVLEKP